VGTRLTEERIAALAPRANEIWYFANLENRATIALHERIGFTLHSRAFHIPGVSFDGAGGGLFRLHLGMA
jgi:ribosomal protein S18 acetylase RimI-like enzyme